MYYQKRIQFRRPAGPQRRVHHLGHARRRTPREREERGGRGRLEAVQQASGGELGALAPDSGATATFAVSASTAGTVTVEFTGNGENVDDASEAIEVTVLDKGGYLDRIQEDLDGAMQTLGEAGLPRGTAKGVEAKLETAIQKVDDAERLVDRGKAGQASNMLGAAANALGAALNQLDGGRNGNGNGKSGDKGGNGGQSDGEPGLLFGAVESLIDELATARAAEL